MISIHAPREGGDEMAHRLVDQYWDFNPRPPRGGRLKSHTRHHFQEGFQSTPPARGATVKIGVAAAEQLYISIHAPREGGDYEMFEVIADL